MYRTNGTFHYKIDIFKSVQSPFILKKSLNKPHGNYPKLERDFQKRLIFVTHVYFYHDNIHSSYLKSLKKKFPKPVPSSCLCTCTYQYFDNLKIKTDYKLSPRSLTHSYFLHPPVPHLTPSFVNRQLGGKIYNQICHPPQNYLIFSPQYHQNTNRLDPMQWS